VSLLDLAPTILDMLKIAAPPTFEGRSMMPLIRGDREGIRSYAYGGDLWSQDYLRTERYKLLRIRPTDENLNYFGLTKRRRGILRSIATALRLRPPEEEHPPPEVVRLYDIVEDPAETVDLSSDKPETVEHLRALLEHHNRIDERKADILRSGSEQTVALDEKTTTFLRALGYIQ
jgi:arylsulfatase A-like enzyme